MSRADVLETSCQLCGREAYRELLVGVRVGPACLARLEAIVADAGPPASFPFPSYLEAPVQPEPRRAVG